MTATEPIVVPGRTGFRVVSPAFVVDEKKELAWAAAAEHITIRPDIGWIVAHYVAASTPEEPVYNTNGHRFELADLVDAHKLIPHTYLNMLHRPRYIVGHYVASELIYPTKAGRAAQPAAAARELTFPHIDTLATFYRSVFDKEWDKVQEAHDRGLMWQSMESYPQSLTCMNDGCCGNKTYPFAGPYSDTYCDTLQKPRSKKILNKPHFVGGGLVFPPAAPGWADASALEVAAYVEQNIDEAAFLYEQIAATAEHLDPKAWEEMMFAILADAGLTAEPTVKVSVSDLKLPTAYEVRQLSQPAVPPAAATVPLQASWGTFTVTSVDTASGSNVFSWNAAAPFNPELDAEGSTGVIVALVPPEAIGKSVAVADGEPLEELHVTLAFLGRLDGDHLAENPDVTLDRVRAAVELFARATPPLPKAEISGVGRFALEHGNEVTYASVDAPGLNELRARLVEALEASEIPVDTTHGFTPHMSLQYHRAGEGPTEIATGDEWPVTDIALWWGGRHRETFPLGRAAMDDFVGDLLDRARDFGAQRDEQTQAALEHLLELAEMADVYIDSLIDAQTSWDDLPPEADRQFSAEERRKLAKSGAARPDGSFPIEDEASLRDAIAAFGRAKPEDRAAVKRHIARRARALGLESLLPEDWR